MLIDSATIGLNQERNGTCHPSDAVCKWVKKLYTHIDFTICEYTTEHCTWQIADDKYLFCLRSHKYASAKRPHSRTIRSHGTRKKHEWNVQIWNRSQFASIKKTIEPFVSHRSVFGAVWIKIGGLSKSYECHEIGAGAVECSSLHLQWFYGSSHMLKIAPAISRPPQQ